MHQSVTIVSIRQLYVKSSIHVALAVAAFGLITILEFELPLSKSLLACLFFSTVLSYNGIKYRHLFRLTNRPYGPELTAIGILTILSIAGAAMSAALLKPMVLAASLIPGILAVVYTIPLQRRLKNLRQIYGLKIVVVGFVWAFVTVLSPFVQATEHLTPEPEMIAAFFQRFLFVVALTIPFDIRDRATDPESLGTIPMIFGNRNAILLGVLLLAASLAIEWLFRTNSLSHTLLFVFMAILTAGLLWKSVHRHTQNLASFWIEGIPIFWALLLFVAAMLNL